MRQVQADAAETKMPHDLEAAVINVNKSEVKIAIKLTSES